MSIRRRRPLVWAAWVLIGISTINGVLQAISLVRNSEQRARSEAQDRLNKRFIDYMEKHP